MSGHASYILDDNDLFCPICFEDYSVEDNSSHTPELLMCLHTICRMCIILLRHRNGSVNCPICRAKHYVDKSDPLDNAAIIEYLRKKQLKGDLELAKKMQDSFDSEMARKSPKTESNLPTNRVNKHKISKKEPTKRRPCSAVYGAAVLRKRFKRKDESINDGDNSSADEVTASRLLDDWQPDCNKADEYVLSQLWDEFNSQAATNNEDMLGSP